MNYANINHLIELIYDAAIDPAKWSDLLNTLAEFVDYIDQQAKSTDGDTELLSIMPGIASMGDESPKTSISETLKSITDIGQAVNDSHVNEVSKTDEVSETNEMLIRHFARAVKIAKRLVDMDEQHDVVLSLLDRLPIALVLVDENGKVVETNTLADEVLLSGNGLGVKSGILRVASREKSRFFETILNMSKHDPATSRGQTLVLNQGPTANNLMLFFAPLKHHHISNGASVAIFISQRKSQPLSLPTELTDLYGLTEKEIAVTAQLVKGLSVKEISEGACVSQHTVRTQVKNILRKTETSRQAELVSLIYNGMGSFVNSIPAVSSGKRSGLLGKSKPLLLDYKTIKLNDGRNLSFQEYGVKGGSVVVHCHSVLGSRMELSFNAEQICKEKNIRLIVPDRPAFGASDPDENTSYTRWAKDLEQLLDTLTVEHCYLTGYAMGGRFALACAHELPERIKRVAIISAGMPASLPSDYDGMLPLYKMNVRLARYAPKVYRMFSTMLIKGIVDNPEKFFAQLSEKLGQGDRDIVSSKDFTTDMITAMLEGGKQGGKGIIREIVQLMHDWGFDLNEIEIPVDIWHGDSDRHVPLVLSKRFNEHLKDTNNFIREGQGHFMFYTHWEEIVDHLIN